MSSCFWSLILRVLVFSLVSNGLSASPEHKQVRSNQENIAVCVTGQTTRLELESKIKNFIVPNSKAGRRMHIFLTLYNSTQVFGVNFQSKRIPSPHAKMSADNSTLELDFLGLVKDIEWNTSKSNMYHLDSIQHGVAYAGNISFDLTVNLHPNADRFSKLDIELAKLGNEVGHSTNHKKIYQREKSHMSQWINVRKCMQLVEQVEIQDRFHFDTVIKMRDDSFFFSPMVLPPDHASHFTTLSCFFWWGINDSFFIIGRRWASCILRGFSEEYYLQHDNLHSGKKRFIGNPEHWVEFHSNRCEATHRTMSMCHIPVLPATYAGVKGFTPNDYQYFFRNEAFAKNYKRHPHSVGYCFDHKEPCPDVEEVVRKFFHVTL